MFPLLIIGPMCSGKTSRLIVEFSKYNFGKKSLYFKAFPNVKKPKKSNFKARSGTKIDGYLIGDAKDILKLINLENVKVIAIDEIQFADNITEVIKKLLIMDIVVIAAGLNGDYLRKPWKNVSNIIPLVTGNIKFLKGSCSKCKKYNSCYSYLLGDEKSKSERKKIIIQQNKYIPLCSSCYNNIYTKS